jgi:ABC-type amino acid transport substrate-binding protein/mono/diheme cytochrome c family protein
MPVFSGEFRGLYAKSGVRSLPGFLVVAALLALVEPASAADTSDVKPLRLCADPENLPYSSDDASKPGFYLEVGQAIGKALGRPVAYNWYKTYFGKRSVRVTLLGGQCDAMIGLPLSDDFMGPAVIFSRKISAETYALVAAKEKAINSVEDLRGRRVAVQYQTAPQNLLALRDDIEKVSVLSPEEAMKALDLGTADVAFVWGPAAGWLNKTQYENRYKIRTVEGEGLSWDAAIGFARTSKGLRDQIDAVLPGLEQKIVDLATKYGLPNDQPITLHASEDRADLLTAQKAEMFAPRIAPSLAANSADTGSTERAPDAVGSASADAGKEVFNATCAHCHGVDAVQGERRIDLRRLQLRYGENARATFWTIVHDGRPSKGMPAWKEVLTDDVLNDIYAYLITIQTPAGSTN